MNYNYEQNIVEIKHEYTTFLMNILTPFIYEGIKSVYTFALGIHKEYVERGKFDSEIKSPGVLKIFQLSLKEIPILNNNSIEIETNRIKSGSKCASWFDSLVRATIKSYIVVLSFTNPRKCPEILKEKHHEKIEIKDFIHKCYIESARMIYNNPELFWHEYPTLEIKRNQRDTYEIIKQAIQEAIRRLLPIELILNEYLDEDYLDDYINNPSHEAKYTNIKELVDRDMFGKYKQDHGEKHNYSTTNRDTHSGSETNSTDTSGETNTSTESSSYATENNTTDDHQNTKNFLKEIESQLHVLDNTMNTVKNINQLPPSPNIPKEKEIDDKNLTNLFEKLKKSSEQESEKQNNDKEKSERQNDREKSDDKEKSDIKSSNKEQPKNIPKVLDPLEAELQNGGKLKQYDPNEFLKPKKLKKNERLLLDEIEQQINNNLQ